MFDLLTCHTIEGLTEQLNGRAKSGWVPAGAPVWDSRGERWTQQIRRESEPELPELKLKEGKRGK